MPGGGAVRHVVVACGVVGSRVESINIGMLF